jgi:hypothetical protein
MDEPRRPARHVLENVRANHHALHALASGIVQPPGAEQGSVRDENEGAASSGKPTSSPPKIDAVRHGDDDAQPTRRHLRRHAFHVTPPASKGRITKRVHNRLRRAGHRHSWPAADDDDVAAEAALNGSWHRARFFVKAGAVELDSRRRRA